MEEKKTLVVSGCSFTAHSHNWPYILRELYDFEVINCAEASQGNGLISRKLIYKLNQLEKNFGTKNLLVGVMWSAIDRSERYVDSGDMYVGPPFLKYNPTYVLDNYDWAGWRMMCPQWTKAEDCIQQYKIFNHPLSSMVYTIEHILRVQWYLEKKGISYFMSSMQDIWDITYPERPNEFLINNAEVRYLYDMIDHTKFLPVKGCQDWVLENCKEEGFNLPDSQGRIDLHPNKAGHLRFTENVILPHLKERNLI